MECKICNAPTKGKRKTCSEICFKKTLQEAGLKTINKNRPIGEEHYLFKINKTKREQDPFKKAARAKLTDRIRRGLIIRLPCEICGNPKSEAHRKDYTKPLDVEWLCRIHHRMADYRDGTKSGDFGH